eukprot:6436566-Lingulodinium_polyedra.AAC.1
MKEALGSRYGERIPPNNPVVSWLPRHVGATLTRCIVGTDGKTAYERMRGRRFRKEVAEFGECVWFLRPKSRGKTCLGSRWGEGIWVGMRAESGEAMIGTQDGVLKVRS